MWVHNHLEGNYHHQVGTLPVPHESILIEYVPQLTVGGWVSWLISVPGRMGKVKKLFGGEGQSYKLITCALPDLIQSLLQLVFSHIINVPQKRERGHTPA